MKFKVSENNYNCWVYFVLACCMLRTKTISEEEVAQAHVLLPMFLECSLKFYKEERLVPNLHLMLHLNPLRCFGHFSGHSRLRFGFTFFV